MKTTRIVVSGANREVCRQLACFIAGLCDGGGQFTSIPGSPPGDKPFQVDVIHLPGHHDGTIRVEFGSAEDTMKALNGWCYSDELEVGESGGVV